MEAQFAPSALQDGSTASWRRFKQKFQLFMQATDSERRSIDRKIAMLLTCGGDLVIDSYNALKLGELTEQEIAAADTKYDAVLNRLDSHFCEQTNEVFERFKFRCRKQNDEVISKFVTELKISAKLCNFDISEESKMIRDQIVYGVRDEEAREEMLKNKNLTLNDAVGTAMVRETAKSQAKVYKDEHTPTESHQEREGNI